MKYLKTVRTYKARAVSHRCLCNNKDYQHDPETGECRVNGCECVRFICAGHGKACDGDGRFARNPEAARDHIWQRFNVSDAQVLDVCALCGVIKRDVVKPCKPRKAKPQNTDKPAIIIRTLNSEGNTSHV